MPACYGKFWEGKIDGPCKAGKGCTLFDECLAHFSSVTLLKSQERNGPYAKPADLASAVGVSPESVLLAIHFQKNIGIVPDYGKRQEPVDSTRQIPVSEPVEIEDNVVRHKKNQKVEPGNSQDTDPPFKPMDTKHDGERFIRERRRTPLIARLTPGMVLPSTNKGERIETLVRIDHYLVKGVKYPTLYSAMVSITGTQSYPKQLRPDGTRLPGTREMTKMSAVRYYNLKKLLGDK